MTTKDCVSDGYTHARQVNKLIHADETSVPAMRLAIRDDELDLADLDLAG
jgi:hypothetical protein